MKKKRSISLSADTDERLARHARLRHTSVSQLVTDWIWQSRLPCGDAGSEDRDWTEGTDVNICHGPDKDTEG